MNKKLVIGNWKMNPSRGDEARKLFTTIQKKAHSFESVETVICPPLIYLESLGSLVTDRSFVVGAQDAFWEHGGAYTGQVSPDMIFNAKARYVIVGHSERRSNGETDAMIAQKMASILTFPLIPILCIGEHHRNDDSYVMTIKQQIIDACHLLNSEQIARIVVAYEPVWAIGKNAVRPCSPQECAEVVHIIRQTLADLVNSSDTARSIPIVYGGSVDRENIVSFVTDGLIDGVLVGRASLDPESFITIIKTVNNAS